MGSYSSKSSTIDESLSSYNLHFLRLGSGPSPRLILTFLEKVKFSSFLRAVKKVQSVGYIPGELSFAANSRELERTRANSGELRANSPAVRRHPHSGELRRTFAGVRRTFAGVRRSSLEFARVRPYSAANWRTVRQKIRSREQIPITSDGRSPWFAANVVRRE